MTRVQDDRSLSAGTSELARHDAWPSIFSLKRQPGPAEAVHDVLHGICGQARLAGDRSVARCRMLQTVSEYVLLRSGYRSINVYVGQQVDHN